MKEFLPNFEEMKFKKDSYRAERGGQATMIEISCVCGQPLMIYQKDGYKNQHLFRTYLNRIFYPEELARLQYTSTSTSDLPDLLCPSCGLKIGTPMKHRDGRLAYGLFIGNFSKKNLSKQGRFR
jgi:hypothetical protein